MSVDTREILTRIALKLDTYENWSKVSEEGKGGNLVLLPGEIGLCEIPGTTKTVVENGKNVSVTTAPTILFKVGTSEKKAFKDLPWASAKAADVYKWAKASEVKLSNDKKKIIFVGGNEDGSDLTLEMNYMNLSDVQAITNPLAERLAALETAVNGAEGVTGVTDTLASLDERLDAIEGDNGTVATALTTAKAYTDEREVEIKKYADQAEADAKSYADGLAATNKGLIDGVDAKVTAHATTLETHGTSIQTNADEIARVEREYKAADQAIDKKLGGSYSESATVAAAIADAKQAGTDAATAVTNLTNGQVKLNKEKSEDNASKITAMDAAYKAADKGLSDRLDKVEAFFDGAAEDSEGLNDALDTLKEIQEFINTDGTTADAMVKDIAQNKQDISDNKSAIDALKSIVDLESGSGGLKTTLENMQSEIDRNEGNITSLQDIVDGYSTKGSIKTAVEKAQTDATNAGTAAATADSKAVNAQTRIGVVETLVNNETTGVAANAKKAADNAADIKSLQDLTSDYNTVKKTANDLKAIVVDGDNSNAKLRADIGTLQSVVNDGTKGNAQLYTDLQALTSTVTNANTGLAKAHELIGKLDSRMAVVEDNFLKVADQLIFQCGTSDTNLFTYNDSTIMP